MRRIRSPKLYRFLKEHGAFQNPREIKRLKCEYRRRYQNQWARQQRKKKHEIRFVLTKQEYGEVRACCQKETTTPTKLSKELLLSHSRETPFVANREQLLAVAKDLGIAINRMNREGVSELTLRKLLSAETTLLNYLKT